MQLQTAIILSLLEPAKVNACHPRLSHYQVQLPRREEKYFRDAQVSCHAVPHMCFVNCWLTSS